MRFEETCRKPSHSTGALASTPLLASSKRQPNPAACRLVRFTGSLLLLKQHWSNSQMQLHRRKPLAKEKLAAPNQPKISRIPDGRNDEGATCGFHSRGEFLWRAAADRQPIPRNTQPFCKSLWYWASHSHQPEPRRRRF